jgi:RimJ/RimL family protein N-acetyltransferase
VAKLVGTVGAFYRESAIGGDGPAELELGWLIFRKHWQKGVATEAATAAPQHAFATRCGATSSSARPELKRS